MIDFACGCTKAEMRAEAVPKIQAPEENRPLQTATAATSGFRAAACFLRTRIANLAERSDPDIGSIGNQAEAREELKQEGPLESLLVAKKSWIGSKAPMIGPAQTTNNGQGLGDTSVREIVSG